MLAVVKNAEKPRASLPNDTAVCGFCATMLKFDSKLQLKLLTIMEFEQLDAEDRGILNEMVYKIVNQHK